MNEEIDNIIINYLEDLFFTYEKYMWKHEESNLVVLIQDNSLGFYIYDKGETIDEFIIEFDDEEEVYNYMCIRTMFILLGNVYIYRDNNVLYNNTHKPYLKLIVNDKHILDMMNEIILLQDNIIIHENMDKVKAMREKANFKANQEANELLLNFFAERVRMTKKLLRGVKE